VQIKIFTSPFSPRLGGFDDEPLREFIADKQVHRVESWHFVYEGTPYWSAFIEYSVLVETPVKAMREKNPKAEKERWRRLLTDRDWPVFNALREWRSGRSKEEGIPAYLVFTNEQLTRMVIDKVDSLSALGHLSGVGPSRIEKYGKDVLRILDEHGAENEKPSSGTASVERVDGVPGVAAFHNGEVSKEDSLHADDSDRQSGAGCGDDADGGAIHEDTNAANPGG
jgi:hypothetical protein